MVIVQSILQKHNADIEVVSDMGLGTNFILSFPAVMGETPDITTLFLKPMSAQPPTGI
jgi:hypothetical protein